MPLPAGPNRCSCPSGNGYPYFSGSPVRAGRLPPAGDSAEPGTAHGRSGGSLPLMCLLFHLLSGRILSVESLRARRADLRSGCWGAAWKWVRKLPCWPCWIKGFGWSHPAGSQIQGRCVLHGGSSDDPESGRPGPPVPGRGRGAVCWCAVHAPHIFSNWTPAGGMPDPVLSPYTGVSRLHCRVELAWGAALVTDLDSRYGTFLSGIRLRPGVVTEWEPGKPLALGSERQTFILKIIQ